MFVHTVCFVNGLSGTADPQGVAAVGGYRHVGAGTMNSAVAMPGSTTITLSSLISSTAALPATDMSTGPRVGFCADGCGHDFIRWSRCRALRWRGSAKRRSAEAGDTMDMEVG